MRLSKIHFTPDIMNVDHRHAIVRALITCLQRHMVDVWPEAEDYTLSEVDIVVLPLERIGAPSGLSGAKVFIAYLTERKPARDAINPSRPLALKIGRKTDLKREYHGTRGQHFTNWRVREKLATPIRLCKGKGSLYVLISPFLSVLWPTRRDSGKAARYDVKLEDLWSLLQEDDANGDGGALEQVVEAVMNTAEKLHLGKHNRYDREERSYKNGLGWYLRKTHEPGRDAQSRRRIPAELFGEDTETQSFGKCWHNPIGLIQELLEEKACFAIAHGSVHGDLHPKNIVLDNDNKPCLIDFGWTRGDAPVVIDYILLDVNLRSITLPSQVCETDIVSFAEYLSKEQSLGCSDARISARAQVIKNSIWDKVEERDVVKDWLSEYVVPFFMMSYGLLVHLDRTRNQRALIASVLASCEYIKSRRGAARK